MSVESRMVPFRDFTEGLNNVADESAISDKALARIINMELDSNGSLVSRPPIVKVASFPSALVPAEQLGFYARADGINFIVYAHNSKTYLFNPANNIFTEIAAFAASGCAQYQNRLYLVARATRGGWWGETTPSSGVYTFQSLAGGTVPMPFGDQIVAYKDRMWIAGWGDSDERTKVYLSEITDTVGGNINNWPLLNFIFVSRGDGEWITKLRPGTNDLTIFRNGSAYYFSYDSDPVLGNLSRYEGSVGTENKYTTAQYENYLYTLSNGVIYQQIGYQFYRRNDAQKVQLRPRATVTPYSLDAAISVVGNRLIVWYQGETYALNLTTFTWSQWDSPTTLGANFDVIPRVDGYFGTDVAYGISGSGVAAKWGVYRIVNEYNSTNTEQMTCQIRTKAYDYASPDKTKRLFWWSADALATGLASGTAVPITLTASATTYDDLDLLTFNTLDTATYDNMTIKVPGVTTNRTSPATFPARISYRFTKKMPFRRIYYELALDCDGSLATGPVHIFSLTTYVEVRQKITKGVN